MRTYFIQFGCERRFSSKLRRFVDSLKFPAMKYIPTNLKTGGSSNPSQHPASSSCPMSITNVSRGCSHFVAKWGLGGSPNVSQKHTSFRWSCPHLSEPHIAAPKLMLYLHQEAIALRLEAIALRLEAAIATRVEAIVIRLEAIAVPSPGGAEISGATAESQSLE